ncbi:MAG: response regulator [Gammaproteobacteria bacterium]|nr:response regulator [Gammaproteobacteria bacterium]MDH5303791.1 response regulator [Gammaproteobacteria bacterium]MDH5322199.1 response regulator [Gammaproteobacteria bacterium]
MTRVIIIDDEEDIRCVLKEILVRAGFEVDAAANSEDGLDLLREKGADLVITDVVMPGNDGVATAYDIRMEFPNTKIIVISGGGNVASQGYQPCAIKTEAYLASASVVGANVTLTKPFNRQELVNVVTQLTEKH